MSILPGLRWAWRALLVCRLIGHDFSKIQRRDPFDGAEGTVCSRCEMLVWMDTP